MSADFTYDYLTRVFSIIRTRFEVRLLGEGLRHDSSRQQLFLRHDVDVSISRALPVAELEAENGLRATYMFIPNSRLYNIRNERSILRGIAAMGHEVALHFDVDRENRERGASVDDVLAGIEQDCQMISDVTGRPVRSISFHRPMPQFLRGELTIRGRTNAYAAQLMELYISDSKGQWRNGDPIPLLQSTEAPVVQLLIHPIWYGTTHLDARERLEMFYMQESEKMTQQARQKFSEDLAFTVPGVQRASFAGV